MATAFRLQAAGEAVAWRRLEDATEVWQFYDGAPLRLSLAATEGGEIGAVVLGREPGEELRGQVGVPDGWWRSAESTGAWSLVGVTVAPVFELPLHLEPT